MRTSVMLMAVSAAAVLLCGCGGAGTQAPAGGQTAVPGGPGGDRAAALHAAARCIREHGIPSYPDPALSADGRVYSDLQSFRLAPQSILDAIQRACGTLLVAAAFDPGGEPPPPPQLVQAGVRAAECLRAHGLPQMRDPNAQTPYAPGHGFGFTLDEMPAGGKFSPVFQRAVAACQAQLDAETSASTLSALSADG